MGWFHRGSRRDSFSVHISDKDWKSSWLKLVSNQTKSVELDLVNHRVQLEVRQLRSGEVQKLIFHILNKEYSNIDEIRVKPILTGKYEYVLGNCSLQAHHTRFDILDTSEITHILTFSISDVSMIDAEGEVSSI